ncbi:MAG: ATP-binding cassette domain-containing protein, partial [bacterium]|nr:ATP-binding cassette domain-containing protein [bacterium]
KGTSEVTKAIVASTATTIAVFTPTIFMQNKYFVILKELSLAVVFPLLISLLVAFTVIPMVASQFLAARGKRASDLKQRDSIVSKWQQNRLMEIFSVLLKSRLRAPRQTFVFLMILFVITLVFTIPFMTTFEDVESEEQLPIYLDMKQGLGLKATDRATQNIEALADSLDIIDEVRSLINEENSTVTLSFLEEKDRIGKKHEKMTLEQVREYFDRQSRVIPDAEVSFEEERNSRRGGGGGGGGGGGNPLEALLGSQEEKIIVKGQDQEKMKHLVEDIEERLEAFPEIRRVRTGLQRGALELQVWGDQEALDQNGLDMSRVMAALWAIRSSGQEMTRQLKDEDGEYLIRLKLDKEAENQTIDEVKSMIIPIPGGTLVPVKHVSRFVIDEGPRSINRIDHERQIEITFQFRDEFTQDKQYLNILRARVDETIKNTQLPRGFNVEIIHEEDTKGPIYNALILAFVLIFMILAATFESLKYPWIIFSAIPLALVGTLWGLIITGTSLSVFAMISLLVLLGIVVNNGIILIDYILILREKHGFSSGRAVLHASRARVRPILMTSVTTILGVLPFALKTGAANEIWPPFAIGLIGGLSFASVLTLVYVPVLFVSIDNFIKGISKGGRIGVTFLALLNVSFVVFLFFWNESRLWMSVNMIFGLVIINAVLFNFFSYLDMKKRKIKFSDDLKISIHNLTKIYNEPGKFKKDWRKRDRQDDNLKKRGELSIDYDAIVETLLWKVPLLGFFIYLHTFIENKFWILVLTILTYFLLGNTLRTLRRIYRNRKGKEDITGNKPKHPRKYFIVRFTVVIGMMVYLKTAWDSTFTWPFIFFLTWVFLWYARVVTKKIYRKEIIVHEITGKFSKTRRRFYRLLLKIPIIGKKKIEVRALHGVNITIRNGMFGLLGPNGAGKSTLMRLISNIFYQSRGIVYYNEYKLGEYRDSIQSYIGYLPQKFGLHGNFTAWNYLNYLALVSRWGKKEDRHKLVESVIKNVNLWDRKDDKIKTYSGGMKQRIGIAQALLNLPKIIVVDEPTSGLDPRERIRFRNMLAEMSKNRIVVFSTHIVEDISTSCREVAVLNQGKVVFQGEPEVMRKMAIGRVWESMIAEKDFTHWNNELSIVSHIKENEEIKIRYIANEQEKELTSRQVDPSLEDAYLLMLNPV